MWEKYLLRSVLCQNNLKIMIQSTSVKQFKVDFKKMLFQKMPKI